MKKNIWGQCKRKKDIVMSIRQTITGKNLSRHGGKSWIIIGVRTVTATT